MQEVLLIALVVLLFFGGKKLSLIHISSETGKRGTVADGYSLVALQDLSLIHI